MHIIIHNPISETLSELEIGESVLIDMNIVTKASNMVIGISILPGFLGQIIYWVVCLYHYCSACPIQN